jgi:hypothetical protein
MPPESGSPIPPPGTPQYPPPGAPGAPGQQGAPGYPSQYPSAPQYGTPIPEPSKKGSAGKTILVRIVVAVVGLAVISGIGYGWKLLKGEDPDLAKVGDCMAGTNADNLKIAKCTDPKVGYKVVGKIDNKSEADFTADRSICQPFQEAGSAFWKGEKGSNGYVLCLAPAK